MKKMCWLLMVLCLMLGCVSASYQQIVLPEGKVLSEHNTHAIYNGLAEKPCQFMTAQCPNFCDHGGIYACFTIEDYVDYRKYDELGDPKQATFSVRIKMGNGDLVPGISPALVQMIGQLTEGDRVSLEWVHLYRTMNHAHFPERIITRLAE